MNYIIVFHDGSRRTVGQDAYDRIISESSDLKKRFVQFGPSRITFTAIAKILDEDEYYRHYPEHRPVRYSEFPKEIFSPTKTTNTYIIEQIIIGLKRYIASEQNQGTGHPEELLEGIEARLAKVRNREWTAPLGVLPAMATNNP